MELNVQVKQAGRRESKVVTAKLLLGKTPATIKELIAYTVKATLAEFNSKTKQIEAFENGSLEQAIVYTEDELDDMASAGKIDFGFLKSDKTVSEETAVDNALQAFEDGIVAVFIDGKRYEDAGEMLELTGGEVVTFVKLTMLAGRMW